MERGICPIATLYSLAAAFQRFCVPAANFVFEWKRMVTMTTGVFKAEIYMTPLHSRGPKIRDIGANSAQLFFTGTELYRFEISIDCNAIFFNFWMGAMAAGGDRGKFK